MNEDGPWIRGSSTGGGRNRAIHTNRDCWRLQRASEVREATEGEIEHLEPCPGSDCEDKIDRAHSPEGHLESLKEAARLHAMKES